MRDFIYDISYTFYFFWLKIKSLFGNNNRYYIVNEIVRIMIIMGKDINYGQVDKHYPIFCKFHNKWYKKKLLELIDNEKSIIHH